MPSSWRSHSAMRALMEAMVSTKGSRADLKDLAKLAACLHAEMLSSQSHAEGRGQHEKQTCDGRPDPGRGLESLQATTQTHRTPGQLRARSDKDPNHRRRFRRPLCGERVGPSAPRNRRCGCRPGRSDELHDFLADGTFYHPEQRRGAPCCPLPQAHPEAFGCGILSG